MRTIGHRRLTFGTIAAVGIALVAGSAVAQTDGSSSIIYACANSKTGALRLLSPNTNCVTGETYLKWNVTGPQGAVGPQGPQGAAGPQGPPGPTYASIRWYRDADSDGYGDWYDFLDSGIQPAGYVKNNLDCADTNYFANPRTTADMGGGGNFGDMDCDGLAGEDLLVQWYIDRDYDGFGGTEVIQASRTKAPAVSGGQATRAAGDCNDTDSQRPRVVPCPGRDATDWDGDAHRNLSSGGDDCADWDANRYPGRAEIQDPYGHDEDCDLTTGVVPAYDPYWYHPGYGEGRSAPPKPYRSDGVHPTRRNQVA